MTDTATHDGTTTIDVQGVTTTVRRRGSGRPLLFLHGAFFPTRWLPFHDALAEHADVIAPVHPGYLEGNPPDWLRTWDDLVLHYRDLLDALDLDEVDVVGYDLGGWLGGRLAVAYPDRVRSLTVIGAPGLRLPDHPMFEYLAADPVVVQQVLFNGDPGEHAELFPDPDDITAFVTAYGENGVTARLIWERRYDIGLERRLARLDRPTLVVAAADDRVLPVEHARRWAELLPDGRLELVDGVGHALIVQAPDTVAALVRDFTEAAA